MPYSLVSAATLGFDLVRLPAGGQVADVLLTALAADAEMLHRLADAHPASSHRAGERSGYAVRSRRAHELATAGVPQLRHVPAALGGTDDHSSRLVALLERGTIGNVPALERLVREDVLGPEHVVAALVASDVRNRAADVLADAAVGWWSAGALQPADRDALTSPFVTATALGVPRRPDLGAAGTGVGELLGALRGLDEPGRLRWRASVDATRAQRRPWAAAMHGACWAAHVAGRTRTLAAAQLMAVQAFTGAGFTTRDGAAGVWNALAGCVQATTMADLLDEDSLAVLNAPWVARRAG